MNHKKILKIIALLFLIGLIVWVGVAYREHLGLSSIQAQVAQVGIWGPLVFMSIYIAATILFLPGSALTIAGGLLFGPVWGTLYNITAATIGATASFLIARYIASDWVSQKAGGRLKQLIEGVEKEGWRFVAVVRLVPLFPFNLLNYALGLTKVSILAYIIASFIFMLPGTIAYTYIGSLGETFLTGGGKQIVTQVFIAFGLLVLVACIPWIVKHLRKNKE